MLSRNEGSKEAYQAVANEHKEMKVTLECLNGDVSITEDTSDKNKEGRTVEF